MRTTKVTLELSPMDVAALTKSYQALQALMQGNGCPAFEYLTGVHLSYPYQILARLHKATYTKENKKR